MAETIRHNYEVSSQGAERHLQVPYARLIDVTPVVTHPGCLTSLLAGQNMCGTILILDAADSIAVLDVTCAKVYYHEVRNVLTYAAAVEATWGAINVGDIIYYDVSATMPAGVYLSTSPLDNTGAANPIFGHVGTVTSEAAALYPLGGITASTQEVDVCQRGAGA